MVKPELGHQGRHVIRTLQGKEELLVSQSAIVSVSTFVQVNDLSILDH